MSLLELLNTRIGEALGRAKFDGMEAQHRSTRGHDPDDFLIRQELKHWAGYQNAPGQTKLRLLQAAALQKDAPVSQKEKN